MPPPLLPALARTPPAGGGGWCGLTPRLWPLAASPSPPLAEVHPVRDAAAARDLAGLRAGLAGLPEDVPDQHRAECAAAWALLGRLEREDELRALVAAAQDSGSVRRLRDAVAEAGRLDPPAAENTALWAAVRAAEAWLADSKGIVTGLLEGV